MPDDKKLIRHIYTPNNVATYTVEQVERRAQDPGAALHTNVDTIDRHMRPLMPGEVAYVLAFTGNCKTAYMQFWARQVVKQLQGRPSVTDCVVYVSWETLVEELGLYDLCGMTGIDASSAWYGEATEKEQAALRAAAMLRAAMPLWVMGHSLKRRRESLPLTAKTIVQSLHQLEDSYGVRPAIIFLDYLQIMAAENPMADRRLQVLETADQLQMMARDCGAPVIVGCQAGRQVLARSKTWQLPEVGDGQETSRIEQDADKVLALWYPCKTREEGAYLEPVGATVTDKLLVFGIRKQRHAPSGQVFPLEFDAPHNTFSTWAGSGEQGPMPHTDIPGF